MIKVGIIGYGTIGKRVADAVRLQDDMQLVGVTARGFNQRILAAQRKGIDIYAVGDAQELEQHGVRVAGTMDGLLGKVDIVVDCTPGGQGEENVARYRKAGVKVILQGGEEASTAECSFNAQSNYAQAVGKQVVRVVSCNTTALSRVLGALSKGLALGHVSVTIMRRAMDPGEKGKTVMNAVEPSFSFPSHHGPDVQTVLPDIDISSVAFKVPTTLMHVHSLEIELRDQVGADKAKEILRQTPRVHLIHPKAGVDTTAHIMEMGKDFGQTRGDVMFVAVWEKGVATVGKRLHVIMAVHQESIVVPENIDCIRAMMGAKDAKASMRKTDETLGLL
jgi:glyceraldehyde-3-phosphate dehydrogenase (NAD(P))